MELGAHCSSEDGRAMAKKKGRVTGKIVEILNGLPYIVIKYNNKCLNIQLVGTLRSI